MDSYYRLVKTVEDDPEFDTKKAQKKLRPLCREPRPRHPAEGRDHGGSLPRAGDGAEQDRRPGARDGGHQRHRAGHPVFPRLPATISTERKSPYQAIVAFSGEHEYGGAKVTEASLNGFPSSDIADQIQEDPYRFLICADKFQTGYDEPLLHTMYVDKPLSGIKAVQTLSRLNRAHPQKHDGFVLDFMNNTETISIAFADYYRTTILSEETDPNKLHDLKAALDGYQVYDAAQVEQLVELYLGGADRDQLDPILDACVAVYMDELDEDGQVDFKGKAKAFTRTYGFLASILPYTNAEWEKLSIFLNFLIPKLPAPDRGGPVEGHPRSHRHGQLPRRGTRGDRDRACRTQDAEIGPVPTGWRRAQAGAGAGPAQQHPSRRSTSSSATSTGRTRTRFGSVITEEIPTKVAADKRLSERDEVPGQANARIEHDNALERVVVELLADHTELFKQFSDNAAFKKWLADAVFSVTYAPPAAPLRPGGHRGNDP